MTNHPPSVLWHCRLGHQTCKNRRPYNLYCVGADVKPCSINQSRGPSGFHVPGGFHIPVWEVIFCIYTWKKAQNK